MTPVFIVALVALLAGGAAVAVQSPLNAYVGRILVDPVLAAWLSFSVGLGVLTVLCTLRGSWVSLGFMTGQPWWAWAPGLCGAFFVTIMTWALPKIGILTATAAVLLGQTFTALMLDWAGAFGMESRAITPQRIIAVVLVLAGLLLSRR